MSSTYTKWAKLALLTAGLVGLASCDDEPVRSGDGGGGSVGSGGEGMGGSGAAGSAGSGGEVGTGGDGANVSVTVGPEGGEVSLGDLRLVIPAGALEAAATITVTATTDAAPRGYDGYSPVYRFEPAGMTFAAPLELRMPFDGDGQRAALFWSREDTTGYERLGGRVEGGKVVAQVHHFSTGFVADGVEYTDPADRSCVRTRLLEGRTTGIGSSLALFFVVTDCQGRPITGLTQQDFELMEDGTRLSVEADSTILPANGRQVFVTLSLDMSSSTRGVMSELVAGARTFVELLQAKGLPVQVGIELFAGEAEAEVWQLHTLDLDAVLAKLDELDRYAPQDPASTNLHGAVVRGVERLSAAREAFEVRNYGGALTTGHLVVFTDGADTSGLVSREAAASAARQDGGNVVWAVGSPSPDFDNEGLSAVATAGVIVAPDAGHLAREFGDVANRIAGELARTYLLGYCSPKRSGTHEVTVGVRGSTNEELATWSFDASGFGPGCSAGAFETVCDGKECGGMACGACDDRVGSCEESRCVSFCVQQDRCLSTFTNPNGYEQMCVVAKPPVLMILQDRSGSMAACLGDEEPAPGQLCGILSPVPGKSRMHVVQEVMREALSRHLDDAYYGLELFGVGAASCGDAELTVPVNTVEPPRSSAEFVRSAYASNANLINPSGGTPSAAGLAGAYDALVSADGELRFPDRANFVVLITDGLMNCNGAFQGECRCSVEVPGCVGASYGEVLPNPTGQQLLQCLDDLASTQQVNLLRSKGINTFVIGLGDSFSGVGLAPDTLDRLADAGGSPRTPLVGEQPPRSFYPAEDRVALQQSIDTIIDAIRPPCS